MSKQVKLGTEARKELVQGIDTLADAVVSTLGPNGRNVVIDNETVQSTKDGVTVAKAIELSDPLQNVGAKMVKQAAIKTGDKAGDGTTTSTLLAREMVNEGLQAVANGENAVQIKRDIDDAVEKVVDHIRTTISEDISSEDQIKQIASISANNDDQTGEIIATAMQKVGMSGVVTIEESKTGDTFLETVEGMQFDKGYKSPYFVTDNNSMSTTLENPLILMASEKLTNIKDLLPILENVSQQARSLLIIADDVENEALGALVVNKMRGILKVVAVQAPEFGDRRKLVMEDIAISTGATVFSKEKGMKWDRFSQDWFGSARTVTVTKDQTTIVDGKGTEEAIESRIEQLQSQIEKADTPYAIEKLQERLAKFTGGVAIIHVGGNTEIEMREKKDRVDDALHATRAAIEEGIVPGGGKALLEAADTLEDCCTGYSIVKAACQKPFEQILTNAGIDSVKAKMLAIEVVDDEDIWDSYNIKTEEVTNFKEAGIIDPTKVTRSALQNAASVAGTILLTEAVIIEEKDENRDPNQL